MSAFPFDLIDRVAPWIGSLNLTSVAWSRWRPRSVIFDAVPGDRQSGIAIAILGLGSGGAFLSSWAAATRRTKGSATLSVQLTDRLAFREDLDRPAVRRVEPSVRIDAQRIVDRGRDVGRLHRPIRHRRPRAVRS